MSGQRIISKKDAEALRKRLKDEGYGRVSGSGRGTSWTRHDKDGHPTVFVSKRFSGEVYYTWEVELGR